MTPRKMWLMVFLAALLGVVLAALGAGDWLAEIKP
jgi:hypothetical protein